MTLRVLLAEDSPTDAKLIARALRELPDPVELTRVEDAEALERELGAGRWDLVLSDWSMPRYDVILALRRVQVVAPDVPFILVSGTVGEEAAVEAMRAGARDYVLKDRLDRLAPAVARELRERADRDARRRAESALRESEGRLGRLEASGVIGIIVGEPDGVLLEANAAFLHMLGRDAPPLEPIRWGDLVAPEADDPMRVLEANGTTSAVETELLRQDGSRVSVLVGGSLLDDARFIAFIVDLTERKRVEAALRSTEAQLRQSQKMEAIGLLAGGIAHDFNNILHVILTYTDLVASGVPSDDPARADLEEIRSAALRAAGLTGKLLHFSRQQVLQPRRLSLNEVVLGMENMLRRLVGENVELVIAAGRVDPVRADPGGMEQVLMNLVVNARDAMPRGGRLTLATSNVRLDADAVAPHRGPRPGLYAVLSAEDTGVGMDAETCARVFEPFFTTKPQGKGTGLGLSTVFGIVKQSGGFVSVESEPGRGTTFRVHLPSLSGEQRPTVGAPAAEGDVLRGDEVVLLVEDDEQVRRVTRGMLTRRGFQVLEARDGADALRIAAETPGPIDVVLSDVIMPGMTGPELAQAIAPLRPSTKVLLMSGYPGGGLPQPAEGPLAYLQKPFTGSTLVARLRELLGPARG